jgi:replicative DNA helicase
MLDLIPQESAIDNFSSIELEQYVLGAILIDNNVFYKVEPYISEGDFTDHLHTLIFKRISECIPKSIRINALYFKGAFKADLSENEFEQVHKDDGYFVFLCEAAVSTKHAVDYAKYLRKITIKRLLNQWLNEAIHDNNTALIDKDPADTIDYLEGKLFKLASRRLDFDVGTINDACDESIAWLINRSKNGLKTGIESIDNATGTWSEGDFIILGALTGIGKTALACSFVRNWCELNKKVACFSMEMSRNQMLARLAMTYDVSIYQKAGTPFNDNDITKIQNAYQQVRSFGVEVYEQQRSIGEIRSILRQHRLKHGLDVIIIDYLGLVKADNPKASKYEQASQVSTALKGLAMEFKVPLLALCQMNRQAAKDNSPPRISELRDSGQIEQDADLIMLLHRIEKGSQPVLDDFLNVKSYEQALRKYQNCVEGTELLIKKSRHWKQGVAPLLWTGTRYISPNNTTRSFRENSYE